MRGKFSRREYDLAQAGGPLQNLRLEDTVITAQGVEEVTGHLSRFGEDRTNAVMIERLGQILSGKLLPTDYDRKFYAHELRELYRYRVLGWGEGTPEDVHIAHALWNNAHTAALEECQIRDEKELYHPDARVFL